MNRAKIAQLPDDAAELKAMVLALSKQYDELYCTHNKLHHTYDELHRTYDELNQKYEALTSTYEALQHDFAMLKEDRKQLYERLCLYQRNRFSRKSEKIDAEGYYIPSLFNEIETIAEKAPTDEEEEEKITVSCRLITIWWKTRFARLWWVAKIGYFPEAPMAPMPAVSSIASLRPQRHAAMNHWFDRLTNQLVFTLSF